MMLINYLSSITFFNNNLLQYMLSLSLFMGGLVLSFMLKSLVKNKIYKDSSQSQLVKNIFNLSLFNYIQPFILYLSLTFSLQVLMIHTPLSNWLNLVIYGIGIVLVAQLISSLLSYSFQKKLQEKEGQIVKPLRFLNGLFKFIIWTIALLIFLDNIGVKISTLVASLGIGGIAIAFAAQAIFEDLLSYVTIALDQPFDVGDYIVVNQIKGHIEHIGLKSTRIRSLTGELIIIPNKVLTNERIHNYKTLNKRRVTLNLSLSYKTSTEQLKEIPILIQTIIEKESPIEFDRCHFNEFQSYYLNFEIVYYVLDSDYKKFMDIQQSINLHIKDQFDKKGLEFAFPTQTVILDH